MESLERELALILFSDAFSMPAPAIEFVRTVCHSDSGAVLSKFAIAALALSLVLHGRETLETIKPFVNAVNSLSDRIAAMLEGGEDEVADPDNTTDPFGGKTAILRYTRYSTKTSGISEAFNTQPAGILTSSACQSTDDSIDARLDNEFCSSSPAADSNPQDLGIEYLPSVSSVHNANVVLQETTGDALAMGVSFNDIPAHEANNTSITSLESSQPPSVNSLGCQNPNLGGPSEFEALHSTTSASNDLCAPVVPNTGTEDAVPPSAHAQGTTGICDSPTTVQANADTTAQTHDASEICEKDRTLIDTESFPGREAELPASITPSNFKPTVLDKEEAIGINQPVQPKVSPASLGVLNNVNAEHFGEIDTDVTQAGKQSGDQSVPSKLQAPITMKSLLIPGSGRETDSLEATAPLRPTSSSGTSKRDRMSSEGPYDPSRTSANTPVPLRVAEDLRRRAFDLQGESDKLKTESFCLIFEHLNPDYNVQNISGLARLDLHGQAVTQAVILTRLHLDFCRRVGAEKSLIITGRGLHSEGGVPVLKPVIKDELSKHCDLSVERANPGAFTVTFERR